MKANAISFILIFTGVGVYFGPQINAPLFPLVQEAHIVGAVALVGGLVVYALSDRKKA